MTTTSVINTTITARDRLVPWQPYTLLVTGTVTDPILSPSTVIKSSYSILDKTLHLSCFIDAGNGSTAGSGDYEFSLPPGIVIDTTALQLLIKSPIPHGSCVGNGIANEPPDYGNICAIPVNNTKLSLAIVSVTVGGGFRLNSSTWFSFNTLGMNLSFNASIPII